MTREHYVAAMAERIRDWKGGRSTLSLILQREFPEATEEEVGAAYSRVRNAPHGHASRP